MTRHTRRGALAAGASTLAALAGCSSLPFTGSDDDSPPAYDALALGDAVGSEAVETPETYPGPVPRSLLATHRDRTEALLGSVPEAPTVPNEAVADRLRERRERVAERASEPTTDNPTLADVADRRYTREDAAEVAFAFRAATGALRPTDVETRRLAVRDDYRTAHSEVAYVGEDAVDALAVGFELESEFADARESLSPDGAVPERPQAAPFRAGEVAASVEAVRAHLDTVAGLRDSHRRPEMTDYWTDIAVAAGGLNEARRATTERVAPFLFDDPEPRDVLNGDAANTTAVELLRFGQVAASNAEESVANARGRGDYATAVVDTARALVDTLATGRAVDAIRDGAVSAPADTAAVVAERDAAVDALREATATAPSRLAALTAAPTVRRFQYADERLSEDPSDRTVVRESARLTYVSYAAEAVLSVVDRVARELGVE